MDRVRHIEGLGYATLVIPDNLRYTLAPLPALAMAAAATTRLHIGTYVLANDLRHPVLLAKDVATLDVLSGGRFELGLGAGRPDAAEENRMLGLPFDTGAVRVARLAESIGVLKALLSGQRPGPSTSGRGAGEGGQYYPSAPEAEISPTAAQRPPLLLAGAGPQMLRLAAREADIIAIGLPPTATAADLSQRVAWIRDTAGDRFADLELNLNLMAVADQVPRWISGQMHLTAKDLADRGSLAAVIGTPDEMCAQLIERRERFGVSYLLVADELMEAFAPVVERLSGK